MSYWLTRFGTTTLPVYEPALEVGSGRAMLQLVDLPAGGAFDLLGSADAVQGQTLIRASFLLLESTAGALKTTLDSLKGLVGKRAKLYRLQADDSLQWTYARLEQLQAPRRTKDLNTLDVALNFIKVSPTWYGTRHGAGWTLDSGEYLDSGLALDEEAGDVFTLDTSPKTCNVYNYGNVIGRQAIITITAGSADITALNIGKSGETDLDYAGTISAGESLVIDCGTRTVENDGADDYANFSLGSGHVIDDWLRLDPDGVANAIVITITGGSTNSQVVFTYYNTFN